MVLTNFLTKLEYDQPKKGKVMFTLKDFRVAEKHIRRENLLKYYHRKTEDAQLCHNLCGMNFVQRSELIEVLVLYEYIKHGYNVYQMGGTTQHYDLWANDEKVEIKSSIAKQRRTRSGHYYYTYSFPGIKPECFDKLILAYITPEKLKLRMLCKKSVLNRICKDNLIRGKKGYTLCHNKKDRFIGKDFVLSSGLTTDNLSVESN